MVISPVTPDPSSASALTFTVPSPIASTLAAESSALTIFKISALSRVNLTLLSVASFGATIASTSVRSPSCILRLPAVSLMLSTFLTTGALLLYTAYTFMSSFTTVSEKKFISPFLSLLYPKKSYPAFSILAGNLSPSVSPLFTSITCGYPATPSACNVTLAITGTVFVFHIALTATLSLAVTLSPGFLSTAGALPTVTDHLSNSLPAGGMKPHIGKL